MKTIGRHLIVELYRCDPRTLRDVAAIEHHMVAAAEVVGATILGRSFHVFEPDGVSGAVVIAESHLSIHTWPRYGYVAVDLFTCGGLDPHPGLKYLAGALGSASRRVQEILRGIPDEVEEPGLLVSDDVRVITHWVAEEPSPEDEP